MSRKLNHTLIVLLAMMVVWAIVCTAVSGVLPVRFELSRLALPVAAFAVLSFLMALDRRRTVAVCLLIFGLSAIIESLLGVAQLAGIAQSRHDTFRITGNFVNPGPFGGYMAFASLTSLALVIRHELKGWQRIAAIAVGSLSFVMMILSRSRAAWLAFALIGILAVFRETGLLGRIRHKCLLTAAVAVLTVAAAYGAFTLKPDSARGRFHFWHMDCLVIADNPLTGAGPGVEMGAFGDVQAEFFASHPRSAEKMRLAGVAEYPFNEFLGAGMSCGLPGLVLAVAAYVLALVIQARRRGLLLWPLAAFGIFALFSYPMSQTATMLVLVLCLADAAAVDGMSRRSRTWWCTAAAVIAAVSVPFLVLRAREEADHLAYARISRNGKLTPEVHARYYDTQRYRPSFLYFYALCEVAEGRDAHALELLESAARLDSEPLIHTLAGDCLLRTGRPAQALEHYLRAYYVAPARVYSLLKVIELYAASGHIDEARAVRDYALSLPFKRSQTRTLEIRKQIRSYEL